VLASRTELPHAHAHRLAGDRRRLGVALALVAGFMGVEVAVGFFANSIAVLADAVHMLSDAGALSLALFAAWIARRPASSERTYGYVRAEILAALANGVMLVALAIWIFVQAADRLADPPAPLGGWILAIGIAGLAVNLAAAVVLGRGGSLNVRAAFRHVLADVLGSVGVVVAGVVIVATGWNYADPLASLAIAVLVLASSWAILRDSVSVLLEGTPKGMDADEIGRAMAEQDGVSEVHDLHVWAISSGFPSLSAHVLVPPGDDCHAVRARLEEMLRARFGLEHTTLQVEHAESGPQPVELGRAVRRKTPLR
jgi:cobalt-zinc-cadmium efflux system protein